MKIDVLGVQINTGSKTAILDQIKTLLNQNRPIFIVTPYSESLVAAQKDIKFRNILNFADFAIPDGAGVLWAARILHSTSPALQAPSPGLERGGERTNLISDRIPGRDFFWDLCELAESRGESVFLLGGFGDTPDIVAKKLKETFPKLRIAGTSGPPPQAWGGDGGEVEPMSSEIIRLVNDSHASFLFVALGPIRQEKWIYYNLPNLHIKLAMGVGGTFDYIAGKTPLPPQFLALHGLEWLWRLLTQPWRAWRITKGVLGLIWHTLKARM